MHTPAVQVDARLRQALKHHEAGQLREAEEGYRATLRDHPEHPVALLYFGVLNYDRREFDEALRLMSRAIAANPREPAAHNHIGLALLARNELNDAVRHFETALRLKPGYPDALNNLGNALKRQKRFEQAESAFRQIIAAQPGHVFAHHNLGLLLFERKRFAEAEREFLTTLELDPQFHKAHYQLGLAAENMGHFADAAARYETVLRLLPDHFPAMSALLALRDYQADEAMILKAERMALRDDLPEPESFALCYGLGKRFERRREYDRAFRFLALANQRRGRTRKYEPGRVEHLFARYRAHFTREFVRRHAEAGNASERPVFVLGMPRTGTTLTEQILAAHPGIFGAGELPDMPRAVTRLPGVMGQALGRTMPAYPDCLEWLSVDFTRAMADYYLEMLGRADATAPRVVDKNPFNFLNVGMIAILFPKARIIHCHRDPMDVGVSCYTELFQLEQDFTTDFGHFAHYYGQYRQLMAHWREVLDIPILEVSYEALVADTERMSREMVAFCGLPWDDACLDFQQTGRAVLTPSKWQVRQPIYGSSVGRWRNYEIHVGTLRAALEAQGVPLL